MILLLSLIACSTTAGPVDGEHRLQRTRAGMADDGAYLSAQLLLRTDDGQPIPCDTGSLTVTVSTSAEESGPFTPTAAPVVTRCAGTPGDLALVLDNSGSTANVVATLRGASSLLVDRVLDRGGRASVTRVSTNARVLHPLTDDSGALVDTIVDGLVTDSNGWTALYDGVRLGNETFGGAVVHREGAVVWPDLDSFCAASDRLGIVVFTDGHENNSADQQDYDHDRYPGDGYDTTVDDLKALHVAGQTTPIYTVGLGDEPDHAALTALANATGGAHAQLTEVSQIGPVFETLGRTFESTHQICTSLPSEACGTSFVKVEWSLAADDGSVLDSGQMVQGVTLDCPVAPPVGRSATILLTMTNPELPGAEVHRFVNNTVGWVSPVTRPRVLVVRDDNHHHEFPGDPDAIADMLRVEGVDVDRLDEPTHGLTPAHVAGYDVVWFSNPGYPPDDLSSISTLAAFNAAGGGLVLQGDDMTTAAGNSFSMAEITGLDHVDNGVRTCGQPTNNTVGENFALDMGLAHPLFAGLSSPTWLYSDDIDESTPRGEGEAVLALAGLEIDPTCPTRPAIVVHDPQP